ncbi:uncharacterized secreted protein ARB_06907-like [Acanthaster planci]|uniref:Uncharacterized secreted protein ARB_06907-like n=1 Tax=Acanthaster planci TaxID=133434 RepID=A0A8B7YN34_ACAPL|nr:uncharacterized secreted protein ARB_06907-like [Acanthaster planci]XP_022094675.1 uncharacterized secreted protein ARB_06907-like [Acanthaster planci]
MIIRRWLLCLLLASARLVVFCKRKDHIQKSALQLFEKESKDVDLDSCKNSQQVTITKLRLNGKVDKLKVCLLKSLSSSLENSWTWSELGSLYAAQEDKPKANTCFKQAAKLSGKVTPFISTWHFIGPFVIGKIEVDGDPLEPWGGITAAAKQRYNKKVSFFSELVPGGEVQWKTYQQTNSRQPLQITPDINFNELVSSLGSLAVTEWQGWILGEVAVNSKDENILVQCLGVHTIFVDDVIIVADVYRRERYWFSVSLSPGIHTVYIRLRAKQTQVLKCSFKSAGSETFEVHQPTMLPDLVEGHIFGNVLALPVTNLQSEKWLKNIRVTMARQGQGPPLELHQVKESGLPVNIAPGQTLLVAVTFQQAPPLNNQGCSGDTSLVLEVSSSGSGSQQLPITLRCRKVGESFLFTFFDHDGSVQHAAAIQPLEDCPNNVCPVLMTLHGTGVRAQNQADGYKRMHNGRWIFGLETAWVLAPTRHGAHNWEGPGALTAMTALEVLQKLSQDTSWIPNKADAHHVFFAGHSMGGHGAWHLATHYPDRALAVISLAGWIKKEEYGDSNVFFRHDLSTSYTDPSVKAIMEACIAENDADKHISNLKGIPVLARIGALDRTVHPYFVRRMVRLLKEAGVNVTYSELPGKEHWWWDTWKTNDGGAVNDPQLRNFVNGAARQWWEGTPEDKPSSCVSDGCASQESPSALYGLKGAVPDEGVEVYTLSVVNPALGEGLLGVQVQRQRMPLRISTVQMRFNGKLAHLTTHNVEALSLADVGRLSLPWRERDIQIDGHQLHCQHGTVKPNQEIRICRDNQGLWEACGNHLDVSSVPRGPTNLGPARRVVEHPFLIVTGTKDKTLSARLLQLSVYIANLFYLASDAVAMVIEDSTLRQEIATSRNLIVVGGSSENSWAQPFLDQVPLGASGNGLELGDCEFKEKRTGALFLAPHHAGRLALVLLGNSPEGIEDVVRLASPTIPPMTRSPFSNLVPDFVVTGPLFGGKGPGGYLCTGLWGNQWDYRPELASCAC